MNKEEAIEKIQEIDVVALEYIDDGLRNDENILELVNKT